MKRERKTIRMHNEMPDILALDLHGQIRLSLFTRLRMLDEQFDYANRRRLTRLYLFFHLSKIFRIRSLRSSYRWIEKRRFSTRSTLIERLSRARETLHFQTSSDVSISIPMDIIIDIIKDGNRLLHMPIVEHFEGIIISPSFLSPLSLSHPHSLSLSFFSFFIVNTDRKTDRGKLSFSFSGDSSWHFRVFLCYFNETLLQFLAAPSFLFLNISFSPLLSSFQCVAILFLLLLLLFSPFVSII